MEKNNESSVKTHIIGYKIEGGSDKEPIITEIDADNLPEELENIKERIPDILRRGVLEMKFREIENFFDSKCYEILGKLTKEGISDSGMAALFINLYRLVLSKMNAENKGFDSENISESDDKCIEFFENTAKKIQNAEEIILSILESNEEYKNLDGFNRIAALANIANSSFFETLKETDMGECDCKICREKRSDEIKREKDIEDLETKEAETATGSVNEETSNKDDIKTEGAEHNGESEE